MTKKALAGLRVIEFGDRLGAAYAGKLLADLGADVIKVEPPTGDPSRLHGPFPGDRVDPEQSGLFLYMNANKRSIVVDERSASGRSLLGDLIKGSDALIAGATPGQLKEAGLQWPDLKQLNPRLVFTTISPYGLTGPYKDRNAYDINTSAAGGVSLGIGSSNREPLKFPLDQTANQSGLIAACAVLSSVYGRKASGFGRHNDVAEAEVWATIHTGPGVVAWLFSGRLRQRSGHRLLGLPWPHTVLPCKDGYFAIQASERRHWDKLVELIGEPDWAKDPKYKDRVKANEELGDELDANIMPWLADRTREEIFQLTREYKIAGAPLYTADELLQNEHLKSRGFWVQIEHPKAGRLHYPGAPYHLSHTPWALTTPAPLLGEHSRSVLVGELGLSEGRYQELAAEGVVKG